MSTETIEVKKREQVGSAACRRLRAEGYVPANLYGHGQENQNLSVRSDAINALIHQGAKILALKGDVSDTALVSEVQWDAFGSEVIHVDLTRVSQSEKVEVTLPIELHGEAPGASQGGQVVFSLHEVVVRCLASDVPEQLEVNISHLQLNDSIHASDLALPSGAELVTPETEVIVQVATPKAQQSTETAEEGEPEVIGRVEEETSEE